MSDLLLVGLAGFGAAMVDGALGMGFGPTSSTLLLAAGVPLPAVSATVNTAKVASGLAAGVSHWRFKNIDHALVVQLAVPGSIGALIGVTALRSIDADTLRPIIALLLVVVSLRMLSRFSQPVAATGNPVTSDDTPPEVDDDATAELPAFDAQGVRVAASIGGVTNGLIGAWGPVVTPFLMHRGLSPRYAIGSVNTAEVAVATVAAGSLIASSSGTGLDVGVVVAMMVGGVLAAPLAAYVIRFVPPRAMGVAVGGMLLLTNLRELAGAAELEGTRWAIYAVALMFVLAAAVAPLVDARPTLRQAHVALLAGTGSVVLGSFLPWVYSGSASRNSYASVRAAERLDLATSDVVANLLQAWYVLPLVAALVTLGLSLHHVRLAVIASAVTALLASGCALLVIDSGVRIGAGPTVCALGSVLLAVGAAAFASSHRRCESCEQVPTAA